MSFLLQVCGKLNSSLLVGSTRHVYIRTVSPCHHQVQPSELSPAKCSGDSTQPRMPQLTHSSLQCVNKLEDIIQPAHAIPFTSPTAPVSAGGDWCGPCLMDLQPVPCGRYQEGYSQFHRRRMILLGVGVASLALSIMTLCNLNMLLRKK